MGFSDHYKIASTEVGKNAWYICTGKSMKFLSPIVSPEFYRFVNAKSRRERERELRKSGSGQWHRKDGECIKDPLGT